MLQRLGIFCMFTGMASNMNGRKALALEEHARRYGHAYIRFDCRGHGLSSGTFLDTTLGDWHVLWHIACSNDTLPTQRLHDDIEARGNRIPTSV